MIILWYAMKKSLLSGRYSVSNCLKDDKGCVFVKILVVEDDRLLNTTLCYNLTEAGYIADGVRSKEEAVNLCQVSRYDLVILDVNLPDGSGFSLCRELKAQRPDTAVIFLTAMDMEDDMLLGYELGADDYVTKPFSMRVFQKKVAAVLSRLNKASESDRYDDGYLTINFEKMSAAAGGAPVTFTPLEYRLLKVFISNPNIVLTRRVLLEKLWDAEGNFVDEHALTVAVSRVRGKIENAGASYIKTVYGMGYMWIGGQNK